MHVSRKLDLNRCCFCEKGQACTSGLQWGSTCAPNRTRSCPRARAMIIIMGCPAPAIFEGRPAPLLPYCEARRSGRMARERGGEGRGEWEKKNAPVLTSRHSTPRIHVYSSCALCAHYIGMPISEIPDSVRARCSFQALSCFFRRSRCPPARVMQYESRRIIFAKDKRQVATSCANKMVCTRHACNFQA